MEDIYAIRRNNLATICKTKEKGNQSSLARELGLVPSLVNRYLGNKQIGDEVARKVETTYRLDYGWMDNLHPTEREAALLAAFRELDPKVQQALEAAAGLSPFQSSPTALPEQDQPESSRTAPY